MPWSCAYNKSSRVLVLKTCHRRLKLPHVESCTRSRVSLLSENSSHVLQVLVCRLQMQTRACTLSLAHKHANAYTCKQRDNVVYWKTKRKIKDDLQCNCKHIFLCTHVRSHTHTHIHIHTHTHTHKHTHTHTPCYFLLRALSTMSMQIDAEGFQIAI